MSPVLDANGDPVVSYAEREYIQEVDPTAIACDLLSSQPADSLHLGIEYPNGTFVPLDEQPWSYKNICGIKGSDPDGDGEKECTVG